MVTKRGWRNRGRGWAVRTKKEHWTTWKKKEPFEHPSTVDTHTKSRKLFKCSHGCVKYGPLPLTKWIYPIRWSSLSLLSWLQFSYSLEHSFFFFGNSDCGCGHSCCCYCFVHFATAIAITLYISMGHRPLYFFFLSFFLNWNWCRIVTIIQLVFVEDFFQPFSVLCH